MTATTPTPSLAPLRWVRLLLAAVMLLSGCVAPAARLTTRAASLRIVLEAPAVGYRLSYKANLDWRRAVATLTPPGGTALTAAAARGGSLTFAGLAPGDGYSLTVTLHRPSPEGPEIEVARLERTALSLLAGGNTLTTADFTAAYPTPALPPAVALGEPFVSSIPEAGAGAMFDRPSGVARDASGTLYVADSDNHCIRKVTPEGVVTTFAGNGEYGFADGTGEAARFHTPTGIALDASGTLYVADMYNHRIRKVSQAGVVSSLAGDINGSVDGTGTAAAFWAPSGVAVDASGTVFVADTNNHRIRTITPAGVVTTLAGNAQGFADGIGTAAAFSAPTDVLPDDAGNLYVADLFNHRIRKIAPDGTVSTLAGAGTSGSADGAGATAGFNEPHGLALDASGTLYVADRGNSSVRKVTPAGVVSTLANASTGLYGPRDLIVAGDTVYVADTFKACIRAVTPQGVVTTFAGNGLRALSDGLTAPPVFNEPTGIACDASGTLYVADQQNNLIRKISPAGVITTLAGSTQGFAEGSGAAAQFFHPTAVALDASGTLYVADQQNHRIRKVSPEGVVSTLAGSSQGFSDGTGPAARFFFPSGVAVDASGTVYVADTYNHRIRAISPLGAVSTLAGSSASGQSDGTGAAARFNAPFGVAVSASGTVYVADSSNHSVRLLTPEAVVTTIAGSPSGFSGFSNATGTDARFNSPQSVAVDGSGNLYVADAFNRSVRKIAPDGVVTTLAGSTKGFSNGPARTARFAYPAGVTVDAAGTVYVADKKNHLVRRIR